MCLDKKAQAGDQFSRQQKVDSLGSGGANRAGQAMIDRPYQLYVKQMESEGAQPLSYRDWKESGGQ